jgi:PBP1b-binding outer membrane lipoprotein LpoB
MKMKKIMNVVLLGMFMILFAGCSGSSDSSDNTSPVSLTVAERIEKAQSVALAKSEGCTIVDTDIEYSLLTGGENTYGNNYISKQGEQVDYIEKVPGSITIK